MEYDEYLNNCSIPEDARFADLYDQLDACPECGETVLVLRKQGYVCSNSYCKTLVIPNER